MLHLTPEFIKQMFFLPKANMLLRRNCLMKMVMTRNRLLQSEMNRKFKPLKTLILRKNLVREIYKFLMHEGQYLFLSDLLMYELCFRRFRSIDTIYHVIFIKLNLTSILDMCDNSPYILTRFEPVRPLTW